MRRQLTLFLPPDQRAIVEPIRHPRNAAAVIYDLSDIAPALAGLTATFRTIALSEQYGSGPWLVKQEYGNAI